ncbi:MAG: DMT family transporter, partial [Myxococcota bacterium]
MPSDLPVGEVLSLLTACCFALSVLFFSRAGERIGSLNLNPIRLAIGLAFLSAYGTFARGRPLPTDASADAWGWLSLSGLVGLFAGDLFLFRALIDVGPRLSALLMSLAPPITALVGYAFLDERLSSNALLGIGLTVVGVCMAVLDRPAKPPAELAPGSLRRHRGRGVLFGFLGAVGQAVGLVLSKRGMGSYDAFASTQVRVIAALGAFAVLLGLSGRAKGLVRALQDRRAMVWATAGAFVGPFLGVGMSLLAVQYVETGIAASLIATTPILVIPFAW